MSRRMLPRQSEWDCHEHRDELDVSAQLTVYHPEYGQLCYAEKKPSCWIYHPIKFTSHKAAERWIREGYISELQEALYELGIGFSNETVVPRDPSTGDELIRKKPKVFVMSCLYDIANEYKRQKERNRRYHEEDDNLPF